MKLLQADTAHMPTSTSGTGVPHCSPKATQLKHTQVRSLPCLTLGVVLNFQHSLCNSSKDIQTARVVFFCCCCTTEVLLFSRSDFLSSLSLWLSHFPCLSALLPTESLVLGAGVPSLLETLQPWRTARTPSHALPISYTHTPFSSHQLHYILPVLMSLLPSLPPFTIPPPLSPQCSQPSLQCNPSLPAEVLKPGEGKAWLPGKQGVSRKGSYRLR